MADQTTDRPPVTTDDDVAAALRRMLAGGHSLRALAHALRIDRATVSSVVAGTARPATYALLRERLPVLRVPLAHRRRFPAEAS